MKKSRLIAAILVIATLLTSLSGCSLYDMYRQYRLERDTPPSYSQVEQIFQRDRTDLEILKCFFSSRCVDDEDLGIYITMSQVKKGIKKHKIDDMNVITAVTRLKNEGYVSVGGSAEESQFVLWIGISDLSCGIAYLAKGDELDIQFVDIVLPLSEEGWYYYTTDYEKFRINYSK